MRYYILKLAGIQLSKNSKLLVVSILISILFNCQNNIQTKNNFNHSKNKCSVQKNVRIDTLYSDSDFFLIQKPNENLEFHSINIVNSKSELPTQLFFRDSILYLTKAGKKLTYKARKVAVFNNHVNFCVLVKDQEYVIKNESISVKKSNLEFKLFDNIWRIENSANENISISIKKIIFENNPITAGYNSEKLYKIVYTESNEYSFLQGSYIKFEKSIDFVRLNPLYFQVENVSLDCIESIEYSGFSCRFNKINEYKGKDFNIEKFNIENCSKP